MTTVVAAITYGVLKDMSVTEQMPRSGTSTNCYNGFEPILSCWVLVRCGINTEDLLPNDDWFSLVGARVVNIWLNSAKLSSIVARPGYNVTVSPTGSIMWCHV